MVSVLSAGKSLASAIAAVAVELDMISGTRLISVIFIMALPDKQGKDSLDHGIHAEFVRNTCDLSRQTSFHNITIPFSFYYISFTHNQLGKRNRKLRSFSLREKYVRNQTTGVSAVFQTQLKLKLKQYPFYNTEWIDVYSYCANQSLSFGRLECQQMKL